jgi:hypothetical protein
VFFLNRICSSSVTATNEGSTKESRTSIALHVNGRTLSCRLFRHIYSIFQPVTMRGVPFYNRLKCVVENVDKRRQNIRVGPFSVCHWTTNYAASVFVWSNGSRSFVSMFIDEPFCVSVNRSDLLNIWFYSPFSAIVPLWLSVNRYPITIQHQRILYWFVIDSNLNGIVKLNMND